MVHMNAQVPKLILESCQNFCLNMRLKNLILIMLQNPGRAEDRGRKLFFGWETHGTAILNPKVSQKSRSKFLVSP